MGLEPLFLEIFYFAVKNILYHLMRIIIKTVLTATAVLICTGIIYSCFRKNDGTRFELLGSTEEKPKEISSRDNLWVFILAGQSNMVGHANVEGQDTIADKRVLTINYKGELILAKEPLHFYEDGRTGLGCGLAFGKALLKDIPDSVQILLIPAAISASSISQWLNDSLFKGVRLLSNFREKVETGMKYGTIKGILWHQGESDANPEGIKFYKERLAKLFSEFREATKNEKLPVLLGELGSFSKNRENYNKINNEIRKYSEQDKNSVLIRTDDLKDTGDNIHFNSESQRILGKRYAEGYMKVKDESF